MEKTVIWCDLVFESNEVLQQIAVITTYLTFHPLKNFQKGIEPVLLNTGLSHRRQHSIFCPMGLLSSYIQPTGSNCMILGHSNNGNEPAGQNLCSKNPGHRHTTKAVKYFPPQFGG